LVRTLESGLLNTNFVTGPGLVGTLATAVQADGKILIGGRRPGEVTTNGLTIYRVLRLLTNERLTRRTIRRFSMVRPAS